jgi:hypothetical protein
MSFIADQLPIQQYTDFDCDSSPATCHLSHLAVLWASRFTFDRGLWPCVTVTVAWLVRFWLQGPCTTSRDHMQL